MNNKPKMKVGAVVLAIVAVIFAFVAYKFNQTRSAQKVQTAELEKGVKELSKSLESAKVEERKGDQELQDAIDKEVSRKVTNRKSSDELKENLKTRASETSTMPALEDASNKSKSLETNVEDLKKKTETATAKPTWMDYNPRLLFSAILLAASLFVILRGTYSETTEKWAFAMISLIAGVWIGTATS